MVIFGFHSITHWALEAIEQRPHLLLSSVVKGHRE